jgi:uncharacterized protein YqeY
MAIIRYTIQIGKEHFMGLKEKVKQDLVAAIKNKDQTRKDALRVLLGEFGRLDTKSVDDETVVRIIRKLIKSEKETLEKAACKTRSDFIAILEDYLPKMATDEEIQAWILENIDFSSYKNKMQAMGAIMNHFGSRVDGNNVKALLLKM